MSIVTWSFPTTVVFGNGSINTLADHVQRIGAKRALVVCDPGVVKAGIAEKRPQGPRGAPACPPPVFDRVDPNPIEKNVVDGVAAFRSHGADVIVSVGGGSPLDVGQAHRAQGHARAPARRVRRRDRRRRAHHARTCRRSSTCPTTAGTGSEVGRSGVVTLEATGRKTVIFSPVPDGEGGDPRSRAHRVDAPAHHGGDRLRRAHALHRGLPVEGRSPDGGRHRARRHRALREAPRRAPSRRAPISSRAAR